MKMVSATPVLGIEEDFIASGCYVRDAFKRYFLEDKAIGGHYQIHLHSNGLCYLTLASTHPLIKDNFVIKSVEYSAQRLSNQVSGKRKRGSQSLHPSSILCTIHTECGKSFLVRACLEGKLAEVNKRLFTTPQEIKSRTRGYLAIFMTKYIDLEVTPLPNTWISEEDFLNGKHTVDGDDDVGTKSSNMKSCSSPSSSSNSGLLETKTEND